MDDKIIRQYVIDALDWDPSVDSASIGVAIDNGVAVLSGHVGDYMQKLAATRIARGVKGVTAVADEIEVRYAGGARQEDEDIAARAVSTLDWDVMIPEHALQVKVSKGWVTLTGELDWEYQRQAAERDVRRLTGVKGVSNQVMLKPRVSPADISERIEKALKREAELDASHIHVSVVDGKAKLEGQVHSLSERNVVRRAAWSAPGIRAVEDHVRIG